jgi:hypothetical protein
LKTRQDEALAVRLNKQLLQRVRQAAKARGIKVSDAAREAMNLWLMSEPSTNEVVSTLLNESAVLRLPFPQAGEPDRARLFVWLQKFALPLAHNQVGDRELEVDQALFNVLSDEEALNESKAQLRAAEESRSSAREWLRRLEQLEAMLAPTQDAAEVAAAHEWLEAFRREILELAASGEFSDED